MLKLIENLDVTFRYGAIAGAINTVLPSLKGATILDVGGLGTLEQALSEAKVQSVNPDPSGHPQVHKGDGRSLPYRNQSFDIVVLSDVLEHVSSAQRPEIILEAARVARHAMVISGPWDTLAARRADKRTDEMRCAFFGEPDIWLKEHRQYGLPTSHDFPKLPAYESCAVYEATPVQLLELTTVLDQLGYLLGPAVEQDRARQKILQTFNSLELNGEHYRRIWVARRQGKLPKQLGNYRNDFTERLEGIFPAVIAAIAEATRRLDDQRNVAAYGLLTGLPSSKKYLAEHEKHVEELTAELERLTQQELALADHAVTINKVQARVEQLRRLHAIQRNTLITKLSQ